MVAFSSPNWHDAHFSLDWTGLKEAASPEESFYWKRTQQPLDHVCELTPHQRDSLSTMHLLMPCVPGAAKQGWNLRLSISISCRGDKPLDCVLQHYVHKHRFLKDCGEMGKVTHRFPLLGKACVRVNTQASLIAIVMTPFCTELSELSENVRPNLCSPKQRVQVRSHLRGKCIPPEKQNKAHEDLKDPGKGQRLEFQAFLSY